MAKGELPKISAKTTIKSYERTDDGLIPKFTKLRFKSKTQGVLDRFVDDKEEVRITIEGTQEHLPGME
ncbi:MAG: hypothetical protein ACYTEQ_05835 [Planctomycetota bacterium]|jgi:hypothetical protein